MFVVCNLHLDSNYLSCEKNWTATPSASGSYGRQAGWQTKIQLDFETFVILYRLNYLNFYHFDISAMVYLARWSWWI